MTLESTTADRVWEEVYDHENDVYYVSFGTGEPSYCLEVDDILLIEIGLYSGLPTGYRILNKTKISTQPTPKAEVIKRIGEVLGSLSAPTMSDRETAVKRSLDRVLV
jgi:hypothetical protein